MLRNIVILDNEPYSEVRKRNFFVDQFESAGYKVYHYTLVNYLTNSAAVNYIHKLDSPTAFCLDNKKQIKNMLKNINRNDTFLFVELHFNKNTLFIFNDLHKIKAKWGRLSYYTNPAVNLYKRQNVSTAARVKRYRNFQYVKFALFVKLFGRKIKSITESHITFKTGRSNFNFPKSRKLVNIDYFDLEEFKEKKYDAPVLNEEHIVFNDIFLPYHPDLQRINQGAEYINPSVYFKELNDFFDRVEDHYGVEVIIAAHPKARYQNEFGTRKVIYGQTANLITNCKLLITHLSISIDYALFAGKPVLFFYTPSILKAEPLQYMMDYMRTYAEKINTVLINSQDAELPLFENLKINKQAYDKVISDFFGEISSDKSNFEKVRDEIRFLLNTKKNET